MGDSQSMAGLQKTHKEVSRLKVHCQKPLNAKGLQAVWDTLKSQGRRCLRASTRHNLTHSLISDSKLPKLWCSQYHCSKSLGLCLIVMAFVMVASSRIAVTQLCYPTSISALFPFFLLWSHSVWLEDVLSKTLWEMIWVSVLWGSKLIFPLTFTKCSLSSFKAGVFFLKAHLWDTMLS